MSASLFSHNGSRVELFENAGAEGLIIWSVAMRTGHLSHTVCRRLTFPPVIVSWYNTLPLPASFFIVSVAYFFISPVGQFLHFLYLCHYLRLLLCQFFPDLPCLTFVGLSFKTEAPFI